MDATTLIALDAFCTHEGIELTFVQALQERGLIELTVVESRHFLTPAVLPRVERLARMHYDLDINIEGIEAISHLLERMEQLQEELRRARAGQFASESGTE
jgi:hypothetical protein